MGLVELVESLDNDDSDFLKKQFPGKSEYLNIKTLYPYELFESIDDHQKPVKKLEEKDFFSKLKDVCPIDKINRKNKQTLKKFNIKMEKNALKFTWEMMRF